MLAVSIILIVWLALWLFFAYQKNQMLGIMTCILMDYSNKKNKEE